MSEVDEAASAAAAAAAAAREEEKKSRMERDQSIRRTSAVLGWAGQEEGWRGIGLDKRSKPLSTGSGQACLTWVCGSQFGGQGLHWLQRA